MAKGIARFARAEARAHRSRRTTSLVTMTLAAVLLTASLLLGATLSTAVRDGVAVEYSGTDILMLTQLSTGEQEVTSSTTGSLGASADDLATIAAIDGVAEVAASVRATAVAQAGDVTRSIRVESLPTSARFVWQGIAAGRAPVANAEVALTRSALDELRIRVGDQVALGKPSTGRALFTVVGVVDTRGSLSYESGYGLVTDEVARRFAGTTGDNVVRIALDPGSSDAVADAVVATVNERAPVGLPQTTDDLVTGAVTVQGARIDALGTVLLALAAVSLVVAALTLATTSAASARARQRTLALARALGADRRHVATVVVREVAVVAVVGGLLGTVLGTLLALGVTPLLGLVPGLPAVPVSSFTITATALVVPLVACVVMGLLASFAPVVTATRVPPTQALSSASTPSRVRRTGRTVALTVLVLAGAAALTISSAGSGQVALVLLGALGVIAGGALLALVVFTAGARLLATRTRRPTTALAVRDLRQRPGAAAAEGVAVVVAVTLIALAWVGISSVTATTSARLAQTAAPDLTVGAPVGSALVTPDAVTALADVPGVASVTALPYGADTLIRGRDGNRGVSLAVGVVGVDAAVLSGYLPDGFPVEALRDDTVYLPQTEFPPFPADGTVEVEGPDGTVSGLSVLYVDDLPVPSAVTPATLARVSSAPEPRVAWIDVADGADRARVSDDLAGRAIVYGDLPVAGPLVADIRASRALGVARAVAVGVLAIAALVAVLGAAGTAAISITERRRELAIMRALGLSRAGLEQMLARRSMLVGSVAAVIGVGCGTFLGWAAMRVVAATLGLDPVFRVPWLAVVVITVGAVGLVRLASILPTERIALVSPAQAISRG